MVDSNEPYAMSITEEPKVELLSNIILLVMLFPPLRFDDEGYHTWKATTIVPQAPFTFFNYLRIAVILSKVLWHREAVNL